MRLLTDTNVIYSAMLFPTGTCAKLLKKAAQGHFEWVISREIGEELELILERPKGKKEIQKRFSNHQIEAFLKALQKHIQTQNTPLQITVPADSDDDHVLSAAIFYGADILVTGDQHLLQLKNRPQLKWLNLKIMTPREAFDLFLD